MPILNYPRTSHGRGVVSGTVGNTIACSIALAVAVGMVAAIGSNTIACNVGAATANGVQATISGNGFSVPTITFTSGTPASVDLSQYVSGYDSSWVLYLQDASTLPASITFVDPNIIYDGTGGAVTVSGLVLFYSATDIPAYIAALSDYQITKLTSTANGKATLASVLPTDWVNNGLNNHKVIGVYSGGACDSVGHRQFAHGGGHNDSNNNGVYQYDYTGTTQPQGYSLLAISATSDIRDAETYLDGNPSSSHTYSAQVYDSITNKLFRFHGSRWIGGGTPSTNWAFDLGSNTWSSTVSTVSGGNGYPSNPSTSLIDESQRKIVVLNHNGDYFFYRIDTNAWGSNGSVSSQAFDSVSAYDFTRSRALVHAPGQLFLLTINWSSETCSMSSISSSGVDLTSIARGPALFYDYVKDRFWMLPITGSSHSGVSVIYEINPTTWAVTSHALSGATTGYVTASDYTGMYRDFCWMPDWRAVGFAPGANDAHYLLRLPT